MSYLFICVGHFYACDEADECVLGMCTNKENSLLMTGDTLGKITVWKTTDYCMHADDEVWSTDNHFHSFVHSGYFYSASSSPLLLRAAPDTARILYWSFTPKQLRVKDLPKVPTCRLERDSNPRLFGRKASTLLMSHHTPHGRLNVINKNL